MSTVLCHTDIDINVFTASSDIDNLNDGFINPFLYKSGSFHYNLTLNSLATILKS